MTDREREIRAEKVGGGWVGGMVNDLLTLLDEARQDRDRVCAALLDTVAERDEARDDALALADAWQQPEPVEDPELFARLDTYRAANSSPSPSSGRDSRQVGMDDETPPTEAGGGGD